MANGRQSRRPPRLLSSPIRYSPLAIRPTHSQKRSSSMKPVVALIAPGNMGAAVGKRPTENGLQVITSLEGRSEESVKRARAAGMTDASRDQIAAADLILSIVPPGDALSLAELLAPALARGNRKPAYVEGNAVNPTRGARGNEGGADPPPPPGL